jgi:hypothetical protein
MCYLHKKLQLYLNDHTQHSKPATRRYIEQVVPDVPALNKGLSCSIEQTKAVPKISMVFAHGPPFHSLIIFCLCKGRIQTSIVQATLCTSVPHSANHFSRLSYLLSTTTICFSDLKL